MIKKIIFSATLALFAINSTALHAMEIDNQGNLDDFTITIDDTSNSYSKNLTFRFRRIILENIVDPQNNRDKQDQELFVNTLSNFDINQEMYGVAGATAIKLLSSNILLKIVCNKQAQHVEKMGDKKTMLHWLIEDSSNNNALVGRISLSTYVDQKPASHANMHLLGLGLAIFKEYRKEEILPHLAKKTLCTLAKYLTSTDTCFCFDIPQEHAVMQSLAKIIGAQKIHSSKKMILDSPIIPTITISTDLFIIPKESYTSTNGI